MTRQREEEWRSSKSCVNFDPIETGETNRIRAEFQKILKDGGR